MSEIALISPEQAFDVIHAFVEDGNLPICKNKSLFCRNWNSLIDSGSGEIIGLFNPGLCGALGYLIYPDINDGEICAIEAFWYVKKESRGSGIKLLTAFEERAIAAGSSKLIMVHLSNLMPEKLKRLYERTGYIPTEQHYMKRVQ